MQKESYDIPAYKFGIIKITDREPEEIFSFSEYEEAIKREKFIVIPFENIDGLTLSEIQKSIGIKEIYMISYISYEFNEKTKYTIHATIRIPEKDVQNNPDIQIDQQIEKIFESNYHTLDDKLKKVGHCFFERYQDKNYQTTKQRIKRLQHKRINRNR